MTGGGAKRASLIALCGLLLLFFTGLGIWQFERRVWKLALIEQVDQRLHAAPTPVPASATWHRFDAKANEYRRVGAKGVFRHDRETLVDALTERGPGDWLVTPLVTPSGTILVNRGFVPKGVTAWSRPAGTVAVRGLLRPSEPHGRFLRANDPPRGRWFSRDVAAIAQARQVGPVAPFFVDQDASGGDAPPIGGMTVTSFRNAHLAYALTWFGLALLAAAGLVIVLRSPQMRR